VHQIRSLFSGAAAKTALVSGAVSVRCLFWQVLINAGQRWADPRALQPPGDAQEHAPGEKKITVLLRSWTAAPCKSPRHVRSIIVSSIDHSLIYPSGSGPTLNLNRPI
jgi:hypothetical protein